MALHNELGVQGENIAETFLKNKGYQILAKNWRYRKSEIDLIALLDENLCFVEVKTRINKYIEPTQAVNLKKQKQIMQGAHEYVVSKNLGHLNIQFDIITIIMNSQKAQIEHIQEAFYPRF